MKVEDQVKNGVVTRNDDVTYKTVFLGKNFHVYRLVDENSRYHGSKYQEEGWVLAWSEVEEFPLTAPTFVPLREKN
jgi:hypothetical protein